MELILSLGALLGALLIGAMSPGPSFILVARIAVTSSRRAGLAAALGMGTGGAVFSIVVLTGLHAVLSDMPVLYAALKLAGGAYLVYLGFCIWRQATQQLDIAEPSQSWRYSAGRSFNRSLGAQLANPKTAVVYGSIFAALLPPELPLAIVLALPIFVFTVETGWYSLVAVVLSSATPRAAYARLKLRIDRAAGAVLGLLGLKLIGSSATS